METIVGELPIVNLTTDVADIEMGIMGIEVEGLDTFTRFEPLKPIGKSPSPSAQGTAWHMFTAERRLLFV